MPNFYGNEEFSSEDSEASQQELKSVAYMFIFFCVTAFLLIGLTAFYFFI